MRGPDVAAVAFGLGLLTVTLWYAIRGVVALEQIARRVERWDRRRFARVLRAQAQRKEAGRGD